MQEDPIGFEASDGDLFRYVANDPTNATDPSGLVSNAPPDADAVVKDTIPFTYSFKQGGELKEVKSKGEITVATDVSYNLRDGLILITFYYPEDPEQPVAPRIGFIQFQSQENTTQDGNVVHYKKGDPVEIGETAYTVKGQNKICFVGDTPAVDTFGATQPWYDQGEGAPKERGQEKTGEKRKYLMIWDGPDDFNPDPKKYKKSATVYDTYLVIGGREDYNVYYHVTWRKEQKVQDGKWTDGEYKDVKGEFITFDKLPDYAKEAQLFGGYKINPDKTPGDKILYKNPLVK
jgi:hypothetical protein